MKLKLKNAFSCHCFFVTSEYLFQACEGMEEDSIRVSFWALGLDKVVELFWGVFCFFFHPFFVTKIQPFI